MSNTSWRGTILFTVILVVMGATVGLKLYGVGEEATSAQTAITSTTASSDTGSSGTSGTSGGSTSSASTPSASSTPSSSPSSSPSASATTATVTGRAVETRFGAVQVKVTFSGTTITAVDTIQYPDRSGRDVEINEQALPILQQEVLRSQSANVDSVSGATYTSEGYIQSVQSAIDQR